MDGGGAVEKGEMIHEPFNLFLDLGLKVVRCCIVENDQHFNANRLVPI